VVLTAVAYAFLQRERLQCDSAFDEAATQTFLDQSKLLVEGCRYWRKPP